MAVSNDQETTNKGLWVTWILPGSNAIQDPEYVTRHPWNARAFSLIHLAQLMKDNDIPEPVSLTRFREDRANKKGLSFYASYRTEKRAEECGIKMKGSTINGIKVNAQYQFESEARADPYPNSNWISINGIAESVNAVSLKVHFRRLGLNHKAVKRVGGLGECLPVDVNLKWAYDKYGNTDAWSARVDVELEDHQTALEFVAKLRLTKLKGYPLWTSQRSVPMIDDEGEYYPDMVRRKIELGDTEAKELYDKQIRNRNRWFRSKKHGKLLRHWRRTTPRRGGFKITKDEEESAKEGMDEDEKDEEDKEEGKDETQMKVFV